ncbi:MAG: hemolysin secretion protein D, partial [Deltaproteobacteria bacterium]|nr:hemolysin secretion protein D [Deltaproteobacteria bacterium]
MAVKKSIVLACVLIGAVLLGTGYALWNMVGVKSSIVISGIVEADDIHVGSKIGGRVLKVVAREGQTVKAGEVLVLLEPREIDASLAEAQAAMRQAQAKLALL